MAPTKMKAAVTTGPGGKLELREIDVPQVGPTDILVKIVAAASNPTDWKALKYAPTVGNVGGCDFSGTVEQIGSEVSTGRFKVGDRVASWVHGSAYPNGAYAEYVVIPAALLLPVPKSWTFEQAAQLGVATFTTCLCLYHNLNLPTPFSPTKESIDILVWGGSSAVGQFVVQFAHLAGLRVIATASPRNFELVKSLGADLVLSHSDPETPSKIKEATGGKLKYAVDCISEGETKNQIAQSIGNEGGAVTIILPYESPREDVKVTCILGYHIFGKDISVPISVPLDTAQFEFGPKAVEIISGTLLKELLKPSPIKIIPNGLAGVNDGLEYMRAGKVSGEKLVYRISDTPSL